MASLFTGAGMPDFIADAVTDIAGPDLDPARAKPAYVRYRPAESCSLLWRLPRRDGSSRLVRATLYAGGRGAALVASSRFRELAGRVRAVSGLGHVYRYLRRQGVLLQAFPLDEALPTLAPAASAAWLRRALSEQLGVEAGEIQRIEATPVSYKPGIRCVVRYDLELRDRTLTLYGKVFRDQRGKRMLAPLRELSRQLRAAAAPWDTPDALGYLDEAQTLLLAGLAGSTELSALIKQAPHDRAQLGALRAHMQTAAAGLACLQQLNVGGLAEVAPHSALRWIESKLNGLQEIEPQLERTVRDLLEQLRRTAERMPPEAMVVNHGAFRYTQCVLGAAPGGPPRKMAVVDLDKLCLSGASADAGEFLSRFDMAVLRDPQLEPVIGHCEQAFVAALSEHSAAHPQADQHSGWQNWYRAFGDIKWALYSFLSLAPGWTRTSPCLLHNARDRLSSLGG
ncbi:MAG: hypothetical protein MJD61_20145 [Proteobacteria bacterium]|nr:hypothetical protein [Pseudomonadota bacterium]